MSFSLVIVLRSSRPSFSSSATDSLRKMYIFLKWLMHSRLSERPNLSSALDVCSGSTIVRCSLLMIVFRVCFIWIIMLLAYSGWVKSADLVVLICSLMLWRRNERNFWNNSLAGKKSFSLFRFCVYRRASIGESSVSSLRGSADSTLSNRNALRS